MSTTTINSKPKATATPASDKVRSELDLLTARLRRDICVSGLLLVAAIVAGTLLVTTVSDAILQPESTGLRILLWVPILAAIAAAFYRFVWNPLREHGNRLALAWSLEEQRPELQERLTSTLLLTDSEQPAAASLVNAVAAQASRKLDGCREDTATRRDWRRPLLAAASCAVIAAFCFAAWPQYLVPSFSNVMAPWKTRQLPHLTATISPGNITIAEGEAVEIVASEHGLDDCLLEIVDDGKVASSTAMGAGENGDEAKVLLPGLSASQNYRVRSGYLVSDVYRITVHPRPVVTNATATLQFPEYTGIPQATIDDLSVPMAAMPGTQVRLSVASSVPTSKTKLTFADELHNAPNTNQADGLSWHHWNLRTNEQPVQAGTLTLVSNHDVSSEPFKFEFRSVPDNPPSVQVNTPSLQNVIVAPDGSLPIQFEAADDFGLHSVEMLTQIAGGKPNRDVVLQDVEEPTRTAEYLFEPEKHGLKIGDELTLWFVASDNRTDDYGGLQTAKSRQLIITIADDATSVGRQQIAEEQRRLLKSLDDAVEQLNAARETAQQIADANNQPIEAGIETSDADTDENAEKLQQQLHDAQQALKDVANPDEGNAPLFADEKGRIEKIADEQVEEAKQQARLIPLTDDIKQKQQNANAARKSIENAEEQLNALRDQLQVQTEKLQQAADLDELARLQNELARKLDEQKQAPEQAVQEQEKIADKLQDIVREDEDAEREQFLQRAEEAEQLAEQTNQLQQQQEQLADTDRQRTKEETREQLTKMIQVEQRALAAEAKTLKDQEDKNESRPAQDQADSTAKARELMGEVSDELGQENLDAAEQKAGQAKQQLQEAANQQEAADGAAAKQQPQAKKEKLNQLAKRQEQIEEAIRAVKEDKAEEAKDKLQDLITDRLEEVTKDAEALLDLPSDDEENEKARQEAKQKLKDALNESKQAGQDKKPANAEKQQAGAKDQQAQQANKAGQPKDQQAQQANKDGQPKDQQQAGQKDGQNAKPNQAGKKDAAQQQQADGKNQQAGAKDQQAQQANKDGQPKDQQQAGQKNDQNAKQNQAGKKDAAQQQQADGAKQQAGAKDQQAQRKPGQQNQKEGQQQNEQQQREGQKQQQKKAAKSLKQASESLQQFCQSCHKCANCNKPSKGGSAGDEATRPGSKKSGSKQSGAQGKKPSGEEGGNKPGSEQKGTEQKQGDKKSDKAGDKPGQSKQGNKPGDKPAENKPGEKPGSKPSDKPGQDGQKKSGSSKQLAKTTDNARKAARKPTPDAAKQVAKELDKLADDASKESGFPRKNGQNSKDKSGQKQKDGGKGGGAKGNSPKGVQGHGDPDAGQAEEIRLRGPSTSEWTRGQKLLRGNVLDRKKTLIPEAYRGVVEDYFEQLSKIQSDKKGPKEKDAKETP